MSKLQSILGITIGPIYEVLIHAKKTRELWCGSFFFSWYMKRLYTELSSAGFNVLSPKCNLDDLKPSKCGLFHDHLIALTDLPQDAALQKAGTKNEGIMGKFISMIDELGKHHYLPGQSLDALSAVLKNYIEVKFIAVPLNEVKPSKIIETADLYLDTLERNRMFTGGKNESTCYRCKSLPGIFSVELENDRSKKKEPQKLCPLCFFKLRSNGCREICDEAGEALGFKYRSTGEISALSLFDKITDKKAFDSYKNSVDEIDFEDPNFIKLLPKSDKDLIKPFHKYMSIVIADGDNLGSTAAKLLDGIDDPDTAVHAIQKFSQILFNFGSAARKIVDKYSGEAVYIGGDDVLAFVPTAIETEGDIKTVIDFARELSENYSSLMSANGLSGTLSIGIHTFYYKAPLGEALIHARKRLNEIAKALPGKNGLAHLITQHSGQKTEIKIKFCDKEKLESINELWAAVLKDNNAYPRGVHHKIAAYSVVLSNLSSISQLKDFRTNRFNELIHADFEKGLDLVFDLISRFLLRPDNSMLAGEPAKAALNDIIAYLRFIKFLTGETK